LLTEAWCEDGRNAVLLTGYSVEGTMAKHLQTDPTHIESKTGNRLARRCRIDAVSFSAHCDFLQTSEFIDLVKPSHIVLVHGEKNQMARLQDALLRKYNQAEQAANKRRQAGASGGVAGASGASGAAPEVALWRPQAIHTPENCVTVEVAFPQQVRSVICLLLPFFFFSPICHLFASSFLLLLFSGQSAGAGAAGRDGAGHRAGGERRAGAPRL
jgi:hypothetical protein